MYQIKIIEVIDSLNSQSSKPWFRYVISNNENTITGYRCGSKKEVQGFAYECIANLNRKYPPRKPRHVNPVQINVSYL